MTYRYLSIRQPWARFITTGIKQVENRDWRHSPKHRGPLFIHAGGTMRKSADLEFAIQFARNQGFNFDEADIRRAAASRRGGIVGIVNVTGVVRHPDIFPGYGTAKGFALAGQFGLQLADARPLPFVRMRGALGILQLSPGYLGEEHRRAWSELARKFARGRQGAR